MDICIPTIGESITEVTLAQWLKKDGDFVNEGEHICEIESEKATVEMPAEVSGILKIVGVEGEEYEIGAKIAEIDVNASAPKSVATEEPVSEPVKSEPNKTVNHPSPAAKKIIDEKGADIANVVGTGRDGRITKMDALSLDSAGKKPASISPITRAPETSGVRVEKMTRLRKTIAKRLVEAKNSTAMLTTFNEIDMKPVMDLRSKHKDEFKEKHEINLGFMSFFVKASAMALKDFPGVNAQISGDNLLYHDYVNMGVAVSTPKGLVVPVLRNVEDMSYADVEKEIRRLALKARDGKISIPDMEGGTFTVTNGGIFGSMLSTPIINIPQSAILGMHNIVKRPWVVGDDIKIRPIMYVALSYDHRVVDGRESVGMLKRVKDLLEDPTRLLLDL
ncbi:2-oxoglutarate dehydrogenase complex dihydrolipoyllysine-residue succinyltransferase [Bacteriovoracaceae bacterium]|nr:2-oxoglutarate dehydrogenase complex dihydrolipoyllysine-residue succinyltransferase [Bacteriovoracaceae bacterium]